MATRKKTVQYAFPILASVTDGVVTNFTQITLHIPESSLSFKTALVKVMADDIITATGGTLNETRIGLRLAAVAYNTVTNLNDRQNSGEAMSPYNTADFTAYFNANWLGASMTCDVQIYFDQSTGTTLNLVNATATIDITYEYDDTATTQVKTVYIPLDAPTTQLASSKPGSPTAVIPALDTWCPEQGKTFRNMSIVIMGNTNNDGTTTDHVLTMELDTLGSHSSGSYEGAMASDRLIRYIWNQSSMTTNATHNFYLWSSIAARFAHVQVYMVVTYTYTTSVAAAWAATAAKSLGDRVYGTNASGKYITFRCTTAGTTGGSQPTWNITAGATTSDGSVTWTVEHVRNSLMIPMQLGSPMGGPTSADYQRNSIDLWLEEPGDITDERVAFMMLWNQTSDTTGINIRVGTGSFVSYPETSTALSGMITAMIRNDVAMVRGLNVLNVDIYRTDTTDVGWSVNGYWFINYLSCRHQDGEGAHNHTVVINLANHDTIAPARNQDVAAVAFDIPETNYFLNSVGVEHSQYTNGTSLYAGSAVMVERLSGEGGIKWEDVYRGLSDGDSEAGLMITYAEGVQHFKQFPNDVRPGRLDIETARRWLAWNGNGCVSFHNLNLMVTYHSMTFTVADSISDSDGGTVNITLHAGGEAVLETTRSGDGAFSIPWNDNTQDVYVTAYDASGNGGRSADGLAV
jgi:hypothetical protein